MSELTFVLGTALMRKSRAAFALLSALTSAMLRLMPALAHFAPGKLTPTAVLQTRCR